MIDDPCPSSVDPRVAEPMTVLFVDDEPALRSLLADVLQLLGYQALMAEDGIAGEEVYLRHADQVDIAMLDIGMPRRNGVELARRLRGHDPGLALIFVSANVDCLSPEYDHDPKTFVLLKPFRIEDMENVLAAAARISSRAKATVQALPDAPRRAAG